MAQELVSTVQTQLHCGSCRDITGQRLHLHPNTGAYWLRRFAALTEVDLADHRTPAELWWQRPHVTGPPPLHPDRRVQPLAAQYLTTPTRLGRFILRQLRQLVRGGECPPTGLLRNLVTRMIRFNTSLNASRAIVVNTVIAGISSPRPSSAIAHRSVHRPKLTEAVRHPLAMNTPPHQGHLKRECYVLLLSGIT